MFNLSERLECFFIQDSISSNSSLNLVILIKTLTSCQA